jgi:hypothetical protein
MGSPALKGFGFDPTPQTAGGGVMAWIGFRVRRCMSGALRVVRSWGRLGLRGRLARGRWGLRVCHISSRGWWCPVLASRVMRSHLDSELASCSGWLAMPVGMCCSVGCFV